MSTTTDRDKRSASHIDPSRADVRRRSEVRQAGSKAAEESEATEIRTLLNRLGDGAEEAERRETTRGRALRVFAAGVALVLVSAGAGIGLTLVLGGPAAKDATDAAWFRPAEPAKAAERGPSPAFDAAMTPRTEPRTDKLALPVARHVEPPVPDPRSVAAPAVQTAAPAKPSASEPDKTASVGSAATAPAPRALGGGRPEAVTTPASRAVTPPAGLSEAEAAAQLARAESMLKNGDLAAARSFFRRIADAGDARGALGMARSYDPDFLKTLDMPGLRPDRAAAQQWYARARSLKNEPRSE